MTKVYYTKVMPVKYKRSYTKAKRLKITATIYFDEYVYDDWHSRKTEKPWVLMFTRTWEIKDGREWWSEDREDRRIRFKTRETAKRFWKNL